ncbi:MAG: hypothetical protein ACPG21_12935 [Crocinitomicaceae bacterium]
MEKADIKLPKYITALYAMTRDQVTKEKLLEHFKFTYRDAVIEREDSIFATITEEAVNKYLTDHEDYRLFLDHIEFMKAYKHSLKGRMRESVKLLKKSIALVPENKYYADVLGSAIVSEAIKYNLELQEITDSTSVYLEKYPFLLEDTDYTSFVFQYYFTVVGESFLKNDPEKGFKYLRFIEGFPDYKVFSEAENVLNFKIDALGQIATYFYRQKENDEAHDWIKKALALDPDDDLTQSRAERIRAKLE